MVLNQLLAVMGVNPLDFAHMLDEQSMLSFQNDFSEIWDLCFEKQYEEAILLLEILKAKPYCNSTNPITAQALLLFDGLLLLNVEKDFPECLNVLYKAIHITSPIIMKNGELNLEFISDHAFTLNEYRIIKSIALAVYCIGNSHVEIDILDALRKSLCNKKVDVEIRNRLLPNIYYNHSEGLIRKNNYKDALGICEKGVQFCKQIKNFKILPYLLYNRAKAFYMTGSKVQAETGFTRSHDAFFVHGDEETATRIKKIVAEKYQIFI